MGRTIKKMPIITAAGTRPKRTHSKLVKSINTKVPKKTSTQKKRKDSAKKKKSSSGSSKGKTKAKKNNKKGKKIQSNCDNETGNIDFIEPHCLLVEDKRSSKLNKKLAKRTKRNNSESENTTEYRQHSNVPMSPSISSTNATLDNSSSDQNVESRIAIEKRQPIYYDSSHFEKIKNLLGGKSGEGLCLKYGVLKKGGKPFMRELQKISDEFLLELFFKILHFRYAGKKTIITKSMVAAALDQMNMHAVF